LLPLEFKLWLLDISFKESGDVAGDQKERVVILPPFLKGNEYNILIDYLSNGRYWPKAAIERSPVTQ
jgi:hypothetical protein